MSRKLTTTFAVAALAVGSAFTISNAQDGARGERGDRAERRQQRGGGGFDREQMRERMAQMMQERLGISEEEWTVLSPKIEAVMELQRDTRGGGMRGAWGGRGGQRGPGGPEGDAEQSAVQQAQRSLAETLQNEDATADEIDANLTALRTARAEAQEKLDSARAELKELVTARQEAMLVMMGMLE